MFLKIISYNFLMKEKRCMKSNIKVFLNRIKFLFKIHANNEACKDGSAFMICSNSDQWKKKSTALKNNPWVFHAV